MELKRLYFLVIGIAISMVNFSCEDIIDIPLKDSEAALIIEGTVSNTSTSQVVRISKSVSISDGNEFNGVSGALVKITDNTKKETILKELVNNPGVYVTTSLQGKPSATYSLNVVLDGKEYKATSKMPAEVRLDSLGISVSSFGSEISQSVEAYYNDPIGTKNYYRFILFLNNDRLKDIYTFNDDFNDGKTVTVELGSSDLKILGSDTVGVQMLCIDQNVHRYFEGLDQNENRGGASTTPANPISNISNGALGYFSAHTVSRGIVRLR